MVAKARARAGTPPAPAPTQQARPSTSAEDKTVRDEALREGQHVYRVVSYEPPEGEDTWQVQERTIVHVTPLKIRLDRPFYGCLATHGMVSKALRGKLFHLTPLDALASFREAHLRSATHHERGKTEATRALSWHEEQARHIQHRPRSHVGDVFVVVAAQDVSDFDFATRDYVVCCHLHEEQATTYAAEATAISADLQSRVGTTDAGELINRLDPRWAAGNEEPTLYRVERIPLVTPGAEP